jgi:hypothetical protein
MHVKILTWFPFTVQVYISGHEWLARQLVRQKIPFEKVDNAFIKLAEAPRAQQCLPSFWQRDWPKFLDRLARQVNPLMGSWLAGLNYYWVIDEAELSTDVLFADRQALADLRPWLYQHAGLCFGAEQIMSFLGRKYREIFAGDVKTYWHRREPGAAVRHCVKRNVLKMYDKAGVVLRIETVINQPKEFFVHRTLHKQNGTKQIGWFPLTKAVANLYRYAQVGQKPTNVIWRRWLLPTPGGPSQSTSRRSRMNCPVAKSYTCFFLIDGLKDQSKLSRVLWSRKPAALSRR